MYIIEALSGIQKRFYKTILQERYKKILLASLEKLQKGTACD